jgi:hypothetical protein
MNRIIINSDKILSFLLSVLVFVLLVDPTNTILKLKGVVFVLFVTLSALHYNRLKIYALIVVLVIYLIVVSTFISGYIAVYKFDYDFTINVLKGFSPLVLLCWIDKYRIINKMIFPAIFICFIVIFTFLVFLYNPVLSEVLYKFFMTHDATIMIGKRSYLGINIMSFFYKTLPILIIPLSIYSYRFFNTEGVKGENFLIMSILLFTLFLGGTRANMLAAILILAVNLILYISKSNLGKLVIIPVFTVIIIAFSILVMSLISEKDEVSNKVKFAHLDSYSDLIIKHPSILLVGQGAGSLFYSLGRNTMVVQTEWSYFEIFRMFGLFGASIVIALFFSPLYIIYKKRKVLRYWIPMFIGYLLYLFVGGTNPLLLGSTGMIVLLGAYSYSLNPYYELKEW